jgi:hypothetical protein
MAARVGNSLPSRYSSRARRQWGRASCLPPLFIQTFPSAPQSSDKKPAPLAEHLNPLTENQFFTQNPATVGQKPGATVSIPLSFAIREDIFIEISNENTQRTRADRKRTWENGIRTRANGK